MRLAPVEAAPLSPWCLQKEAGISSRQSPPLLNFSVYFFAQRSAR